MADADDDFVKVVKPVYRLSQAANNLEKLEELTTKCSICNQSWTNSGMHRIVSLKCGHLFGERCVLDLLKTNTNRTPCPFCGTAFRKGDLRAVWPSKVFHEEVGLTEMLKDELKQAQAALEQTTRQLVQAQEEFNFYRDQLRAAAPQTPANQPASQEESALAQAIHSSQQDLEASGLFQCVHSLSLSSKRKVARALTVVTSQETVVVGKKGNDTTFGLLKCHLRDLEIQETINNVHTASIRDVKYSDSIIDNGSATILSTGIDKTLKLTSITNNCVLQKFLLPAPGWSCEFDCLDPNIFYCGLANNMVHMYDVRNTKCSMDEFSPDTSQVPLHTLLSYQPATGRDLPTTPQKSLFCGSLKQAYRWDWYSDAKEHAPATLGYQKK
ncbi:hypothetical protein DM01DRAFT_1318025, partial [Hesseltinella vesiculosa]